LHEGTGGTCMVDQSQRLVNARRGEREGTTTGRGERGGGTKSEFVGIKSAERYLSLNPFT